MVNLKHNGEFQGRHMETGTICNALACRGIKAPYNQYPPIKGMWGTMPILAHGYDETSFSIADRSKVSWKLSRDEFMAARAKVKEIRFRAVTLSPPDKARLKDAVLAGIRQCISLFCDGSPRGAKDSFGFGAFQNWAEMLVNKRNKQSWERVFSTGRGLYQGLVGMVCQPGVFGWIMTWSGGPGAARGLYADFLEEAAIILGRPHLNSVARQFRQITELWCDLAESALPESIPCLYESGKLLMQRRGLFVEKGLAGQDAISEIDKRLEELANASKNLDPSSEDLRSLRATLREKVLRIHELEREAIESLRKAVA